MREVRPGARFRAALPPLEDRVRMRAGEDPLYGSQFVHGEDGKPESWPVEDEARVEERRASVGLEPLALHLERVASDICERPARTDR